MTYQVTRYRVGEDTGITDTFEPRSFASWEEARSYISRTTNHNCYQTDANEWRTPWLPKCVDGDERICFMYRINETTEE